MPLVQRVFEKWDILMEYFTNNTPTQKKGMYTILTTTGQSLLPAISANSFRVSYSNAWFRTDPRPFNYFNRLSTMDSENIDTIERHAFCEQRSLNLNWYQRLTSLRNIALQRATFPITYSNQIKIDLKAEFEVSWNRERNSNKKLTFNNSVKTHIGTEVHLNIKLGYK